MAKGGDLKRCGDVQPDRHELPQVNQQPRHTTPSEPPQSTQREPASWAGGDQLDAATALSRCSATHSFALRIRTSMRPFTLIADQPLGSAKLLDLKSERTLSNGRRWSRSSASQR